MKVTHISTFDSGGAGIAALRLHNGLLCESADSNFLSLWQFSNNNLANSFLFDANIKLSYAQRALRKFGFSVTQEEKNRQQLKDKAGNYEIYSFPFTDYRVEQHPIIQQTDIINLHWVAGFINYPTFFQTNKPIVWTLHDMNPFMGGFHYSGDYERNKKAFENLEQQLIKTKQNAYKNANITVVTPSAWLGKLAKQSDLLQHYDVRTIPNSVDTAIFKPHDKILARNTFNLPADKQIILFVSDSIHNYRKGFDLLIEAFKHLNLSDEHLLVTVGQTSNENTFSGNTINLGKVNDERLMSLLYSAADVFVLPSREDNLPNVLLESTACGTPVIAFNIGGIPEVIQIGFNGILANEISVQSLQNAITQFVNKQYNFDRNQIRKTAIEKFALHVQARKYTDLYKEIIV